YVQRMHGDRKWIQSFISNATSASQENPADPAAQVFQERAHMVDVAYSTGQPLTDPVPFFSISPTHEPDQTHWSKPAMMLADELSVSCADFVPLITKSNGMVT